MSFLPSTNRAGILAGIYLTNCIPGPLSIFWNVSYCLYLTYIIESNLKTSPFLCFHPLLLHPPLTHAQITHFLINLSLTHSLSHTYSYTHSTSHQKRNPHTLSPSHSHTTQRLVKTLHTKTNKINKKWTPANIAGATKRAFVTSLQGGLFAAGSVIGPQAFQARDAPEYRPAKITVLATQAAGACTTLTLFLYYAWQNRVRRNVASSEQRDKETEEKFLSPETWARMTDRENGRFRYSY